MTKDEAETAANEATALLAALIKVTRGLGLAPEQTAAAVLDALIGCPRAPHWWRALECLNRAGIRLLKPATTGKVDAPPRLHS
jgi:hypothetical protein